MTTNKENMLDYIGDKMDALDFDGDLNINWDKEAHVMELEYTITVETNKDYSIEDQEGEVVDKGEVSYDDAVLFYDKTRVDGEEYADNYLAIIPFAGKKGIDQATVDGFFEYFQQLLDDGESDLLDFVDGTSEDDNFALDFDQEAFEKAVAAQPAAKQSVFYGYPKY
ncbi:DUF3013 family protein [Lacticaseibacillus zhaodongensis]|uniref:DUF3013 family protein n=1 Tax=Lacticaseibacillus zhaodongensis TaxID=2668065 RepID=UPI0012D33E63|nr:DUF3013 family protein [Lacticaseibacillus zhaodongensis]